MNPDRLIDKCGRTVTIYRLSGITLNDYDEIDTSDSTIAPEDIKVVISQPSDEIEHLSQGLGEVDRVQITVKSDLDISTNRNGRADRIDLNVSGATFAFSGTIYEVVQINRDEHPFVSMYKQTAILESMDTRGSDD